MSTTIYLYHTTLREDELRPPINFNSSNTKTITGTILSQYGDMKNNLDVVNPTILVNPNSNISDFNFAYIPEFNRYYFITVEYTAYYGYEAKIHCRSAVLYNNYSEIIKNKIVATETTNYYNKQLTSNQYPILAQKQLDTLSFEQLPYQDCFILTTLGG